MNTVLFGDARASLATFKAFGVKAQMCVTSPPYFRQRDYGVEGQFGQEETPEEYVANLVDVFRGVRDLLADDGTFWLNIGDGWASRGGQGPQTNAGAQRGSGVQVTKSARFHGGEYKEKDLFGIPWMLAFALRADGWYLRQEIIWAKAESGDAREGRCMPSSATDRFTTSHETIFLLSKQPKYHFDADAVKEPAQDWGKPRDRSNMRGGTTDPHLKHGGLSRVDHPMGNRRSVWRVSPAGFKGAHFAVYPWRLIEPCVLAGSRPGDIVLDPFMGSGTTAGVALKHGRQYIGCELNREYESLQAERIASIISA